jgi:hypothetical protein
VFAPLEQRWDDFILGGIILGVGGGPIFTQFPGRLMDSQHVDFFFLSLHLRADNQLLFPKSPHLRGFAVQTASPTAGPA